MKRLMSMMVASCKKTTELIEKQSVDKLSIKESLQLKFHMSMCSTCTAYYKSSKNIDEGMSDLFKENKNSHLSEKTKSNILKEIKKSESD